MCVFLQIRQHLKQKHTKTHMYILLYIIANPKTRMCFEVFKPPREYKYVFLPQALMPRKNKQGCPHFLSLEQEFLISCYGAAMLAMLADATSSCPKAMNSSYTCYMTMYVLTNRSAALHTFQLTNQKKMIKWSNLLAPCLPRWWKQIHMHVQCFPWAHPIRFFSLRRACQAEKIIKSRDFKLLLRKHV